MKNNAIDYISNFFRRPEFNSSQIQPNSVTSSVLNDTNDSYFSENEEVTTNSLSQNEKLDYEIIRY